MISGIFYFYIAWVLLSNLMDIYSGYFSDDSSESSSEPEKKDKPGDKPSEDSDTWRFKISFNWG